MFLRVADGRVGLGYERSGTVTSHGSMCPTSVMPIVVCRDCKNDPSRIRGTNILFEFIQKHLNVVSITILILTITILILTWYIYIKFHTQKKEVFDQDEYI